MAFKRENFNVLFLNQSKAPSEYGYVTVDTMATVLAANYFNDLYDILKVNDLIRITADTTGTPVTSYVKVSANAAKVVTIADGTDLA